MTDALRDRATHAGAGLCLGLAIGLLLPHSELASPGIGMCFAGMMLLHSIRRQHMGDDDERRLPGKRWRRDGGNESGRYVTISRL